MDKVYINSSVCISSQNTLNDDFFYNLKPSYSKQVLKSIDPNYKDFISPAMSRRMSKGVKISMIASTKALEEAEIIQPDAIIVGTGMGCSQDSEKFLKNILDNHEEFLTPTFFIQSTHNTVSGQIALALNCHGYNFTYANTSSSLEFSLLDAMLQIQNHEANYILVGSADEQTDRKIELYKLNHSIKNEKSLPADFLNSKTDGFIWGEGSSFFVLSKEKTNNSYASLKDISIINQLYINEIPKFIEDFLIKNNLTFENIDAVILGYSGDHQSDSYYHEISKLFKNSSLLYFKHLSGEFKTSSGFSTFMACHILKNQDIPNVMKINDVEKKKINNILLYNHFKGKDHGLILLEKI